MVPRLTFDRPLDPATIHADSFRLHSGELNPGGTVSYSVVDRTLTFTPGVTLRARLAYVATLDPDVRGLDGSRPAGPVEVVFVTGSDDLGRPPPPPDPTFDEDVFPVFEWHCASCHGFPSPDAGLSLDTPENVLAAATLTSSEWLGWAIVAAGSPARSYLLYKVVGAPGLIGERMPPGEVLTRDESWMLERWMTLGARR